MATQNTVTTVVDDGTLVLVPTAINVVLMAAENISRNLRKAQIADLQLPSLYKQAYLVVNETDEIAVLQQGESA